MSILQFKSDFELDNSTARTVAIASLTSSYLAISIAIASLLIFFCLDSVLSQLPKLVIGCLILIFKQIHRFHRFALRIKLITFPRHGMAVMHGQDLELSLSHNGAGDDCDGDGDDDD